jgi:hypothetical protein
VKDLGALTNETAVRSQNLKVLVEQYTGLDKDALHIHIALLVYLLAMVVFRQSRRSRFPWLVVLLLELTNETLDLRRNYLDLGRPQDLALLSWRESVKDLWNTMLWPSVLLVVGRYTKLFAPKPRPAHVAQPELGKESFSGLRDSPS